MAAILDLLQSADHVLYYLGLSSALKACVYYIWSHKHPQPTEYVGKVTQLYLYPLKSGHPVPAKELKCSFVEGPRDGYLADRNWIVTTSEYEAVTYRQEPKLVTVHPQYNDGHFVFKVAGTEPLEVNSEEVKEHGKLITVSAYGVTVLGYDCGEAPATWISNFLQKPGYRVVYAPPDLQTKRAVPGGNMKYKDWLSVAKLEDKIAYQSCAPYHVLTEESVSDLNSKLESPVSIDRFRANIVIKGLKSYDEDTWKEIQIGEARFSTVKLTGRCVFTTIDTATGTVGVEPLKTLNKYRVLVPDPVFGPCLGLHMVLSIPGTVHPGDLVYATRGNNLNKPTDKK